MKIEKKYYSISEVSKLLGIKEHVIRHWDSIDLKTKKLRIEGLSIRTKGGTRFFNKSHIKKLNLINNLLKENGKRNYTLDLASKFLNAKNNNQNFLYGNDIENKKQISNLDSAKIQLNYSKIREITNSLKKLIINK